MLCFALGCSDMKGKSNEALNRSRKSWPSLESYQSPWLGPCAFLSQCSLSISVWDIFKLNPVSRFPEPKPTAILLLPPLHKHGCIGCVLKMDRGRIGQTFSLIQ